MYAAENSVVHKRFFYNTAHMPLTHAALAHSIVLGKAVNREPAMLAAALPSLCRISVFWYDALVRDPPIRDFSPSGNSSLGYTSFMMTYSPPESATPDEDYYLSEKSIAYHLPSLTTIRSLSDFFAHINTVILMGAYDLRFYPHSTNRPDILPVSPDDRSLLQLAHNRVVQLRQWLPTKYEALNRATHEDVPIEGLLTLSLFHHSNVLYRYKRDVERRYGYRHPPLHRRGIPGSNSSMPGPVPPGN